MSVDARTNYIKKASFYPRLLSAQKSLWKRFGCRSWAKKIPTEKKQKWQDFLRSYSELEQIRISSAEILGDRRSRGTLFYRCRVCRRSARRSSSVSFSSINIVRTAWLISTPGGSVAVATRAKGAGRTITRCSTCTRWPGFLVGSLSSDIVRRLGRHGVSSLPRNAAYRCQGQSAGLLRHRQGKRVHQYDVQLQRQPHQ
ncbi:uncharacterized protein LOC108112880 [Drosophila eugracilis]|uniref:uncharacterized protein LOC108112880 n=1 Tax=Drosophila eugracilis TaxID=29029 RepID=UPI0007E6DB98|nr:uncharacterized protein LOC108112880 [Drosophila eugracilis]